MSTEITLKKEVLNSKLWNEVPCDNKKSIIIQHITRLEGGIEINIIDWYYNAI